LDIAVQKPSYKRTKFLQSLDKGVVCILLKLDMLRIYDKNNNTFSHTDFYIKTIASAKLRTIVEQSNPNSEIYSKFKTQVATFGPCPNSKPPGPQKR
jgi:hypothetical protein